MVPGGVTQEAPVWALLDEIGLPFREMLGALTAAQGTRPVVWSGGGLQLCDLPGRALVPGLSGFAAQFGPGEDTTLPPYCLQAQLRTHSRAGAADLLFDRRAQRNFAAVVGPLDARLGNGQDISTSNALTREWRFGMASLIATAFPLHLNRSRTPNRRHVAEPGSQTECGVQLYPGWLPPLGAQQLRWVADFRRIGVPPAPFFGRGWGPPRWTRMELAPGYGPSADGGGFVVATGEFVKAIARADIIEVRRAVLTPARGPGGVELVLTHAPRGVAGVRPHQVKLAAAGYGERQLVAEGQALARAVGLPLVESEDQDG